MTENKKSNKRRKIKEKSIDNKRESIELEITQVYAVNGVRIASGEGNVLLDFFLNTPESQEGLAPAKAVRLFTTITFLEGLNKIISRALKKYKKKEKKKS